MEGRCTICPRARGMCPKRCSRPASHTTAKCGPRLPACSPPQALVLAGQPFEAVGALGDGAEGGRGQAAQHLAQQAVVQALEGHALLRHSSPRPPAASNATCVCCAQCCRWGRSRRGVGGVTQGEGQVAPRYQAAAKPTVGCGTGYAHRGPCRSACTAPAARYGARASAGQARRLLRAGVAGTRLGRLSCAPPLPPRSSCSSGLFRPALSALAAGHSWGSS